MYTFGMHHNSQVDFTKMSKTIVGIPLVIEMDENMKYKNDYYLADEAEVKAAMERVANQGKAK